MLSLLFYVNDLLKLVLVVLYLYLVLVLRVFYENDGLRKVFCGNRISDKFNLAAETKTLTFFRC